MKRTGLILLVAIAASMLGTRAYAHNSFAATYFVDHGRTPDEIVNRLAHAALAVMSDPAVIRLLNDQQVTPMATRTQEFEQLIKSDLERWANVIKTAGIRPE